MISRAYYAILLLLFVVFGITIQKQSEVPNQEILIQFEDPVLSSKQAKQKVEEIKFQLQSIGVSDIKITQEGESLKITYFSSTNIGVVKQLFSVDHSEILPLEEALLSYNLNVYEIQDASDDDWGFNGTYVLELKLKSDRFNTSKDLSGISYVSPREKTLIDDVAFKINSFSIDAIDNTQGKIPEVRAGPLA